MLVMVFMASSLLKSLRDEYRQMELHEALLKERLQRLIEEHDAREGADFSEREVDVAQDYIDQSSR